MVEWCHMTYFSWNRWKTADLSKRKYMKMTKCIVYETNSIIAFQWGVIHPNRTSGSEIQMLENWETKKLTSSRNFSHTLQIPQKFCGIARKCVKLNFRKWKVINEIKKLIELLTKFSPHPQRLKFSLTTKKNPKYFHRTSFNFEGKN